MEKKKKKEKEEEEGEKETGRTMRPDEAFWKTLEMIETRQDQELQKSLRQLSESIDDSPQETQKEREEEKIAMKKKDDGCEEEEEEQEEEEQELFSPSSSFEDFMREERQRERTATGGGDSRVNQNDDGVHTPHAVVLQECRDPTWEPTEEEISAHAKYLGIKLPEEKELLSIAREALKASLPTGWVAVREMKGEERTFFSHIETGRVQFEHPADELYRHQILLARQHRSSRQRTVEKIEEEKEKERKREMKERR
ncbi:ww domain protein, partial [Cystoisospora suis]